MTKIVSICYVYSTDYKHYYKKNMKSLIGGETFPCMINNTL